MPASGETIEIDGSVLPFRPVAVVLGKTVNNGWGGYECCWARTMLAALVGALEVPGGTLGTTTRLNKPIGNRLASVKPGEDGFMAAHFNATDRQHWAQHPTSRNAHTSLVPLVGNSAWSQALGPTQLAWMFLREAPTELAAAIGAGHLVRVSQQPGNFVLAQQSHGRDDGENAVRRRLRLHVRRNEPHGRYPASRCYRSGKHATHSYRRHQIRGAILGASRRGLAPAGGAAAGRGVATSPGYPLNSRAAADCSNVITLRSTAVPLAYRSKAATTISRSLRIVLTPSRISGTPNARLPRRRFSNGAECKDLAWFKEHGFYAVPFKRADWYLYPTMVEKGLRFELPYQERLVRAGRELANRLHEQDIHWWDDQLEEYAPLPEWDDVAARWERALRKMGGEPADYPLWLITTKSMQYSAGNNVGIPLMNEVGGNMRGHGGVILNVATAERLGIRQGDGVEVRSITATHPR